jgi:hypothetical protein
MKPTKENLLEACYASSTFGQSQRREFDCLISLVNTGVIDTLEELAEYGVEGVQLEESRADRSPAGRRRA